MYLSILILPLLGSIVSGILGRKIGVTGSHIITCSCLIFSSVLATFAFYEVGLNSSPVTINLFSWINSEFLAISWEFLFDSLTVSMLIPVLYISSLIHIFSTDYMAQDPHSQRFFSYLSLFTFFMVVLVTGANYFVMFIGWEGIGVVSYLLINFWFTRLQANKAAILAFTMNRVGDMGLSIGFFAMFAMFGSLDFSTVFSLVPFMNETAITIISLLLFIGAMAKSSQIPLHSWLPLSMEGPTPVSALIHAATLVYTTKNDNIKVSSINKSLDPYFVTGYSDGESSFSIRLRKSIDSKWGYKILPVFSIGAEINPHNKVLLEKVKEFFGGIG
jgi:NADH-ubiquinone oxidoreductase chain 5